MVPLSPRGKASRADRTHRRAAREGPLARRLEDPRLSRRRAAIAKIVITLGLFSGFHLAQSAAALSAITQLVVRVGNNSPVIAKIVIITLGLFGGFHLTRIAAALPAITQLVVRVGNNLPIIAKIVVITLGLFSGFHLAQTAAALPAITQLIVRGGNNALLGNYGALGLGFAVSPDTTFTLGSTYTDALGLEPLVALTQTRRVASDWTLSWTLSRGDFNGDYRVERVPEVTLTTGGNVGSVGYSFQMGAGHFLVRTPSLEAVRGVLQGQIGTSAFPPGSFLGLSASTGYTQYIYSGSGALHGAWWGAVQLSVAPEAILSMVFTYYRQIPSGVSTSPLLFDTIGQDHYIAGTATLKAVEAVTVQHSQTYSLMSQSITARVYTLTVLLRPGQSAGISWDEVPRKLSFSYSQADLGTVTLGWEVTTQRVSFGFQR